MESVDFHELLHLVMVDYPENDGIPDFLVVDENAIDFSASQIYVSHDGRNPLNITQLSIDSSAISISGSQIQVLYITSCT